MVNALEIVVYVRFDRIQRRVRGESQRVRNEILGLSYEPSEYRYFKVYEPKERQIMALPFYDRVVQHAFHNKKPLPFALSY